MTWKRGLVAASAAAVVTLLVVAIVSVVRPAADQTELANSPAETGRPAAVPSTELSLSSRPSDSATPSERSAPKKSAPALDPAAVDALKEALNNSRQKKAAPVPSPSVVASPLTPTLDFVISSFNVLGSSHSAPGGTRSAMAPGKTRIRGAARLLARHGVDVVGFQELQLDQARTFLGSTNGRYGLFPGLRLGGRGANNSIAWRTDTWEVVDSGTIPIPYFNGSRWPMPVVLLRNRETGLSAYFANFHNPASTRNHPNQRRWRRMALAREVALVNRLVTKTGYPVFLTGDLNERRTAFCAMTGRASMIAANGGSHSGPCRPPREIGIDWIFGSADVTFSNYRADRSRLVNRTSDHPMLVSNVRIGGESPQR